MIYCLLHWVLTFLYTQDCYYLFKYFKNKLLFNEFRRADDPRVLTFDYHYFATIIILLKNTKSNSRVQTDQLFYLKQFLVIRNTIFWNTGKRIRNIRQLLIISKHGHSMPNLQLEYFKWKRH